jgi:cell division cycle 14
MPLGLFLRSLLVHQLVDMTLILFYWIHLRPRFFLSRYRPFRGIYPPFPPFHDASPCVCTYTLTVFDCLKAIAKAREHDFFNFETFDVDEYEHFEKVENGDLNWIIQDKILQFAGPHDQRATTMDGYVTLVPEDYIPYFKQKNVKLVIRLNKKYYDERRFTREGIQHRDMYYLDGSCPPDYILRNFLEECEKPVGGGVFMSFTSLCPYSACCGGSATAGRGGGGLIVLPPHC